MKVSVLTLTGLCCLFLFSGFIHAQGKSKGETALPPLQAEALEKQVSELMADRVNFKKDVLIQRLIEMDENARLVNRESLLFPAEELYGSHWDNGRVDPFLGDEEAKADFPDTYAIDCSSFVLPIDVMLKVNSKYGMRRRRMHRGIDLKVSVGDTIRSAFDGRVRISSFERRGYGYYLVIRHPNGLETVYGHLSKFLVNENDIVYAGSPIGLGGNTGRSTGPHLHFETRFLGQAFNPQDIIDFEQGVPYKDSYVFRNVKIKGKKSNIYTSSDTRIVYHRVKQGETLSRIAGLYGTTVEELCRLNGLKRTDGLRVGQAIRCCNAGVEVAAVAPSPVKKNVLAGEAAATAAGPVYHKMQAGDTLSSIALRYGTTVGKLFELNDFTQNTILRTGETVRCF